MLVALLRAAASVACLVVVASFALFAIDELDDASRRTTDAIAGARATHSADPSPAQERAREAAHGDVREAIDDVNDVLVTPFAAVAPDDGSPWLHRGVPALLALLVYGAGIGFLTRALRVG